MISYLYTHDFNQFNSEIAPDAYRPPGMLSTSCSYIYRTRWHHALSLHMCLSSCCLFSSRFRTRKQFQLPPCSRQKMGVEKATSSLSTRLLLLSILAIITVRQGAAKDYKLGVLLPYSDNVVGNLQSGVFSGTYYAAAVTLAVEKVNSDPRLLPGSTLSFVWNNTQCDHTRMVEQQRWQIQQGVSGFIGPICHGKKAAKIAAKHDLAVISFVSAPLLAFVWLLSFLNIFS